MNSMGRLPGLGLFVVAFGYVVACGGPAAAPEAENLPPIPSIQPEAFPKAARAELQRRLGALEAAPADVRANADLAMVTHAYDQYAAAQILYDRAARLEPSDFRWPYYLGALRAQQGDLEAAVEAFQKAAAINEGYMPLQRRLADAYLELNRLDEAWEIYDALLDKNPDDPAARYGAGRVQALRGDSSAAVENLLEAIRLIPDYGAAHYELSLAYRDLGETEKARMHLERHEGEARGAPPMNDKLMEEVSELKPGVAEYVTRAREHERRGQLQQAIDEHLEALELHPEVAQLHVNLVSLYGRTEQFERAAEHYRKALAINPNQADLHYNYGVLLHQFERYGEAWDAFERAVEANPDYAEAHNNLGQLLERQGRFDEALERYRKAVQARPDYRLARFHLGRMLLGKRRPEEAARQFEAAASARDEMTPQILFGLTAAKVQMGDRSGALTTGEKAKQLAEQMGQTDLARSIERDLAKLR
jgi:tetratricopeptide (TPR) repeat protein